MDEAYFRRLANDFATQMHQAQRSDPPFAIYLQMCLTGPPALVELYEGRSAIGWVDRFSVRKIGPGTYRGVLLFKTEAPGGRHCEGKDSSAEAVAAWLRREGVPVLRIGPPAS